LYSPFSSSYPQTIYSFPQESGEWLFETGTHFTTVAQMPSHLHYGKNSAVLQTSTTHTFGPTLGSRLGDVHISGKPSPTSTQPANFPGPYSRNVLAYESPTYSPTNTLALGDGHSHGGFTGGIRLTSSPTIDLRIKYIYAIIASRS
jgi:hypothetical protein